ncbi:hypothetical protein BD311DRAFT_755082 [Dichomitus squalens]|uniref:Uncharacterized protein n=1 Tax=Dichomitus squalens TaxID=114155 RepID=A0A4Q9MUG1_9APHY|nr:hypothetical protein BD311DRAFT_755082 [Dichomitus squalens]
MPLLDLGSVAFRPFQLHIFCRGTFLSWRSLRTTGNMVGPALSTKAPETGTTVNHIHDYFALHPCFDYKPGNCFIQEFRRLARKKNWQGDEWKRERRELGRAMIEQFGLICGKDAGDLRSWQNLCSALGVSPIPSTIAKCREILNSLHVNLVDFIHRPKPDEPVQTFKDEVALSEYTLRTGRTFPREDVPERSLLECLLRHILKPSKTRGLTPKRNQTKRRPRKVNA